MTAAARDEGRAFDAAGALALRRPISRFEGQVALAPDAACAGGVFQNVHLAEGVLGALGGAPYIRLHGTVPPGDGGLALGQAIAADAIATRRQGA